MKYYLYLFIAWVDDSMGITMNIQNSGFRALITAGMFIAILMIVVTVMCGACSAASPYTGSNVHGASQIILMKIDTNVLSITDIVDEERIVHDYGSLVPGLYAIQTPSGYTQEEAIVYYSAMPGVFYAEADGEISAFNTQSSQPTQSPQSPFPLLGVVLGLFGSCIGFRFLKKSGDN